MFKNPFSFNGRIRRLEFGLSLIVFYAFFLLVAFLSDVGTEDDLTTIVVFILLILAYWFYFAQASKRCHDRNNSGFYLLIPFYFFWMLFADSDFGINDYGENPKGLGNFNEIDQIGNQLESDNYKPPSI
ncbi:MAG TPA: DUF805 domain-containing protein [Chitinophagaceae bacterium]|nr:DUF805 domain-containing protein [Chitinophagaceae bacterium]